MKVGIWATPCVPDDVARWGGVVVARPEAALPAGVRRASVYRWPALMAAVLGLKAVASAVVHASAAAEAWLDGWPAALGERVLASARRNLVILALLGPLALLVLWAMVGLSQFLIALMRTATAPLLWYAHAADLAARHHALRASPEEIVRRLRCDVWIIPSLDCDFPYPPGVPAVVVDRGDGPDDVKQLRREQALLWGTLVEPHGHRAPREGEAPAEPTKLEPVRSEGEAHSLIGQISSVDGSAGASPSRGAVGRVTAPLDPLPALLAAEPAAPPGVLLFLPRAYQGGVWEAARTLVNGLAEVNRGRLRLTLAVPPEQATPGLRDDVRVERLTMRVMEHGGETVCVPFSPSSAGAAAWFALVDRFPAVVWPARPLGLIVHDVIQHYVPESFPPAFLTRDWPIIRRTVARADLVITTNEVTRRDVMSVYGLSDEQTRLVHVACEPHRRFGHLTPTAVAVPDGCVLNPTNAAPHKGAEVMLRGYARLRGAPPLVLCGAETDRFAPSYRGPLTPYWASVRRLARRLGLRPGRDVFFLGYVDDAQLLDLFSRCRVVVNAARYDNGTFSLIEAHHFGKPTVCSRYPAAVSLYERFGVPVRYFDVQDDAGLAAQVRDAIDAGPLDVGAARCGLADVRHSHERFADEVYDGLLGLVAPRSLLRRAS